MRQWRVVLDTCKARYDSEVAEAPSDLFYTPREVADMFRVSAVALNSQRKRGVQPGALAVKVGGKYLYPTTLIDRYLEQLARTAQDSLGLDETLTADLFRTPPTNRRVLSLSEAAGRLHLDASTLSEQWKNATYPGALGWRATPDSEIVFAPRELDIWIEANANQERQDAPTAHPN